MSTDPAGVPPPRLKLHTYSAEDATVVECSGRLTTETTAILTSEVKRLIPQAKRIILDLSDLTQMDSSGLGTLARLYVSANVAGCQLRLINLSKRIRELLAITNLLSLFETVGQHLGKIP